MGEWSVTVFRAKPHNKLWGINDIPRISIRGLTGFPQQGKIAKKETDMKFKPVHIILFLLFVFLSTTGEQCDVNTLLFANNADYNAIRDVINMFKDGINSGSEAMLKKVISKQYGSAGLDQLGMIKNYFDQELKINDLNISNMSVDGSGAQAQVDWTGKLTLKPKPNIPYIADKIPTLTGDVTAGLIFGFVKESDGKWRIKAQKILQMTRSAVWGKEFPEVSNLIVDKPTVNPGDTIKVNADLRRVGGNVMLAAVNNKAIVNSILGVSDGAIDTVKLSVPKDKKDGSTFDVYVIALGVNANFANPAASKIVGITLKQVCVPVEKK